MSTTVKLVIETVGAQFPGGTIGGDWVIVTGAAGSEDYAEKYTGKTPETTFKYEKVGSYWARGVRTNAAGDETLGAPVTVEFTIEDDSVVIQVASGLTAEILTGDEAVQLPA